MIIYPKSDGSLSKGHKVTNPYRFTPARLLREVKMIASNIGDIKIINRIDSYMLHRSEKASKKMPAQFRETLINYIIAHPKV